MYIFFDFLLFIQCKVKLYEKKKNFVNNDERYLDNNRKNFEGKKKKKGFVNLIHIKFKIFNID
jgi:hypothetical protein